MKFKKEYFKAIDNYKKAIEINPKLAEAYSNLGNIYSEMKRYEEAIYNYEIAMTLNYKIRNVAGNILINKLRICDWENYYEYVKKYKEDNKKYDVINSPFINLLIDDDLKNQKDVTIKYVNELYGNKYYNLNRLQKNNELKIIKGKIKIAYFSADIYYHAVSIWLAALLENHNKNKFEIYLFSLNNKNKDEMHIRIKNSVDHFIEIDSKSDQEIINFCHLSEIDIAIDLNGFTENSRTSLFASRLAAIQVSHIGYPATMGAKFIDYYISDYKSIEEHEREYYEEKIAYIPCTYTYDLERKCLDNNLKRKDYGLPDQSFVFTCQNGSQKINPIIFDTWLEILKEVKGSVLWLMTPNETAQKNLINYAYLRGVNKERIIFSQRKIVPSENEKQRVNEYITSYKLADLFLDTWPYNAGTTAVDALRAGLPIITRKGSSFVSRLASSALYSIDVTELITNSIEEYKTKAIELAHNMDKYNKIKNKIEKNIEISNIFKPNLNTKKIEHAYEEMIKNLKNAKTNKNIFIN
jgi:predicted O-linked N-acetylglucosamine transferase (SPINDLY family)